MREVSFVKKLRFNFKGSVTKRALVIGDADNDQHNELVCANLIGDLAVFKDRNPEKVAYAQKLGMVTACVVGDVVNSGRNHIAAINTDGWLFIFDVLSRGVDSHNDSPLSTMETAFIAQESTPEYPSQSSATEGCAINKTPNELSVMYSQRMPANCKELLLADLDGDGQNELIIGLTDRVLRTYKWIKISADRGKFVGLYKWEFADQIGAVSLNPSRYNNCQDIIVAQPGGTYAKLECFDKKTAPNSMSSSTPSACSPQAGLSAATRQQLSGQNPINIVASDEASSLTAGSSQEQSSSNDVVKTEYISRLTPEYHQLALSQMRNQNVSTEVLGGIKESKDSGYNSLIVIATLDGTLMLVDKDKILWSLQVDHQLFALAIIETQPFRQPLLSQSESTCTIVSNAMTPDLEMSLNCPQQARSASRLRVQRSSSIGKSSQYFAVCSWDGKTYIVDEDRNYLRFKFHEAVSAFTAGNYYFDEQHHTCLAYSTFNDNIILFYDVILDHIRPLYLLEEILHNKEHQNLLAKLEDLAKKLNLLDSDGQEESQYKAVNMSMSINSESLENSKVLQKLLREVLYNLTDEEL